MMRLVTMMLVVVLAACGPDVEPKRGNACAQAEAADDRNTALMTPDGGCHVCYEVPATRPGGYDTKYGCDCEVDDCGYWSPDSGSVEWVRVGAIKYEDDHQAACEAIPAFADELTCTP